MHIREQLCIDINFPQFPRLKSCQKYDQLAKNILGLKQKPFQFDIRDQSSQITISLEEGFPKVCVGHQITLSI